MIRKLGLIGAIGALAIGMAGCDDDDDTPAVATLSGTAAVGAVLANAAVEAMGANGQIASTLTDADGRYTLTVTALTAPIIITVVGGNIDPDGSGPLAATGTNSTDLFSVAFTQGGTANVTTLTTLALQNAAGSSNLLSDLFNGWGASRPTQTAIETAAALVRANLAPAATGISGWESYNLFSAAFPAIGTGVDALMDAVTCTASGSDGSFEVSCTGSVTNFDPDADLTNFLPGSTGGGGGSGTTPVVGGGGGTITVTDANPVSGNGAKVLTGATVTVDGVLTRIQMEGNDFMVKVYYTTATGIVSSVSYLWGNVDFTAGDADNVAFCSVDCATTVTVDTIANTVTFAGTDLISDSKAARLLSGTITGLTLADISGGGGGGGGGCTSNCQMTATYTSSFTIPAIPFTMDMPAVTETVSGTLAGITADAIRTSVINENDEFGTPTNIVITPGVNTATQKTFTVTFTAIVDFGGQQTANYTTTYDYVQLPSQL